MIDKVDAGRQQVKLEEESKFFARTPSEEIGPMYPVIKPEDRGTDLVQSADGAAVKGQIIYIQGKVSDLTGEPITGAEVEVWHADPKGRYPHPCDMNPAEIDPNFTGWANITTGPDGRYHLRSTKPGPYPTSTPGWWRPPHIHFQVTTAQDRMVTQMYLPNEKLNRQDELLARHVRLNQDDRVMARLHNLEGSMEADAISIEFNIILPTPRTIASQRTVRAKE